MVQKWFMLLSPCEKDLSWVTVQCSISANCHLWISRGTFRCHSTYYLIVKIIILLYLIISIVWWVTLDHLHLLGYSIYICCSSTWEVVGNWTLNCPRRRRSCRNAELETGRCTVHADEDRLVTPSLSRSFYRSYYTASWCSKLNRWHSNIVVFSLLQ